MREKTGPICRNRSLSADAHALKIKGEDMNKKYLFCLLLTLSMGAFLFPASSFAIHNSQYSTTFTCDSCHPKEPGTPFAWECIYCHNNSSGGNYNDNTAPEKGNHSNALLGSSWVTLDTWNDDGEGNITPLTCTNCHNQHKPNGFEATAGGIQDPSYALVELDVHNAVKTTTGNFIEYTFDITNTIINNPDWADPSRWGAKTGNERGLLFVFLSGKYFFDKVVNATEDSITIRDAFTKFPLYPPWPNPFHAQLMYGQFIDDQVNGTTVDFSSPSAFGNDESGTSTDPTPDGICQVCHTQTDHWRSDGSLANHFSSWRCTVCHLHEQGFKYIDPENGCHTGPQETVNVLDQWNVDIQGDAGSTLYGQQGTAHPHGPDANGVWNVMNLPPLDGNPATMVTDPLIPLVNKDNIPGPVTFSLIGSVGGWSGIPNQHTLIGDYLILLGNHYFGYPDSAGINISGLEAGATYDLFVRTGEDGHRTMQTTIDLDGDGSLANETAVTTLGGGTTSWFRFTANASGTLIGEVATTSTSNEADLAGIILKKIEIIQE